jgi:hypothetical protein
MAVMPDVQLYPSLIVSSLMLWKVVRAYVTTLIAQELLLGFEYEEALSYLFPISIAPKTLLLAIHANAIHIFCWWSWKDIHSSSWVDALAITSAIVGE